MSRRRDWTVETLHELLDVRLTELNLRMQQRFEAAEKANALAFAESQRWRDAANEWRGAMNDRERMLMPRSETEQRLAAMAEKLDDLKGSSRAGASALWGYLLGAASLIGLIVTLIVK